ncbi:MAG TPA: molybdopterin-dependent oxidoreductase, partial [Blattabacteriaceae bacterium]|nr:molybdopterin-dependent oxidoreductase [Blattabacteriaceae bacterium]
SHSDAVINGGDNETSRRRFLSRSLLAAGAMLLNPWEISFATSPQRSVEGIHPKLTGAVLFDNEPDIRKDEVVGAELGARLFTDLSTLEEQNLVVPAGKFYIRTGPSKILPVTENWAIRIRGRQVSNSLRMQQLEAESVSMGASVMECAGNTRATGFGLISAGNWGGIPIGKLLDGVKQRPKQILFSGFDEYAALSTSSIAGASWIFNPDQLLAHDSFLATHLNGARLTADHGGPFRLVVPGFYGCANIKWVNEIVLLDDEESESTSQMLEYASRTHQSGLPSLAREYEPPLVEPAAMPIRVERWQAGADSYEVVGIAWGGRNVEREWEIQFNPDEEYEQIRNIEVLPGRYTWALWRYKWKPTRTGTFHIQLRPRNSAIPARRVKSGHYMRSLTINKV